MSENKPLTISAEDMKALQALNPFTTFEQVPIVEVRMMCLEVIGSTERCFPKLAEWVPGWLKYFLEREDARFASRLLNVWLFHSSHTSGTLASAVGSALAIATNPEFAGMNSTLEVFSREICPRLCRDIGVYWEIPWLHIFLDDCLKLLLSRSFYDKEKGVVRRVLKVVCEAEDTSVIPRLTELLLLYRELHKQELQMPATSTLGLWQKVDARRSDVLVEACIDYLVALRRQEAEQWAVLQRLLDNKTSRLNIPHSRLRFGCPYDPATVGLVIGGANELEDKSQLMKLLDGLTVTLIGDGIKDSQVHPLLPAETSEAGRKVGIFNRRLECLFRLEGLEGKKRYRLLVDATKPVPEIRPTLLCTLTGYANFA